MSPALPRPNTWHTGMAALLAGLLALDLALAHTTHNAAFGSDLASLVPAFLFLAAIAAYCAFRNLTKCLEATLMLGWAIAAGFGVDALVLAAGHSSAPLADARLAAIDRAFGFSTAGVVDWIAQYPHLRAGLAMAYNAMPVLVLAALFLPVVFGQAKSARRFVLAVLIAAAITALSFAFVPAAGPWVNGSYHATAAQHGVETFLIQLKAGGAADASAAGGIVSFPSFHVVLALLPVFALWRIRVIKWFAVMLALLICVSTVTTGWHYGIDVLGGIAVAVLAQYLALRRNLNHDPAEPR